MLKFRTNIRSFLFSLAALQPEPGTTEPEPVYPVTPAKPGSSSENMFTINLILNVIIHLSNVLSQPMSTLNYFINK